MYNIHMAKARVNVTIDPDVFKLWAALARARGLSRSALLTTLVTDEAERRGVKIDPPKTTKPRKPK